MTQIGFSPGTIVWSEVLAASGSKTLISSPFTMREGEECGAKLRRFRDQRLTGPWTRYLTVPAVAGSPPVAAAFWFGLHQGVTAPYFLSNYSAWAIALATIWYGGLTSFKNYLDHLSDENVATVRKQSEIINEQLRAEHQATKRSLLELGHLVSFVRIVVGAKARRFYEALESLPGQPDPAKTFFQITQPVLQIKQLVSAIHGFYRIDLDPLEERIRVSLMRPNGSNLEFRDWFPEGEPPRARDERFDGRTFAGAAFSTRSLLISSDIERDDRYWHFSRDRDSGSMFSYPVIDSQLGEVVFVINVLSSKVGRFSDTPERRDKIMKTMEIFAERMILENRLDRIKRRAEASTGGNARGGGK